MGIAARLYQDGRWAERHAVELEATLRDSDWAPVDVTIEDLSHGGFRVVAGAELLVGDAIALGIAGIGTREAKVVWGAAGIYGCEFIKPLNDTELRTAVAGPVSTPIAFPKTPLPTPQPTPPVVQGWSAPAGDAKFSVRTRLAIVTGSAVIAWILVFALGYGLWALAGALLR
ncbi:PilZ domain-containing protein [Sphingomonas azotifigens]|uniref:PilZ domain-containing protein n=1 Tax=Sphingomonas azotifigens TaxID=330920 RepID=UPI000A06F75B|nr:PilZ domain-containing protein [Sphingomonas azotifigens]